MHNRDWINQHFLCFCLVSDNNNFAVLVELALAQIYCLFKFPATLENNSFIPSSNDWHFHLMPPANKVSAVIVRDVQKLFCDGFCDYFSFWNN